VPIISYWFIEGKVLRVDYVGHITTQDLVQAMDVIVAQIDTSDSPLVHTLVDNSLVTSYPTNVVQVIQATRKLLVHPRYGWLIVFGQVDRIVDFVLQTVASAMRVRLRLFHTYDEALTFLQSMDSTISLPVKDESASS